MNRFDRFRGHWFDASFLEEELGGAPVWENPHGVAARDIEWRAFLRGIPLPEELCEGIALEIERIDPPLMVALPQLLKSVLESVRRSDAAPGFAEIAAQLARLGVAARSFAAVAQGHSTKAEPTDAPEWWRYDDDDSYRKYIELGQRIQDGRNPCLHPLLQDHLTMAMAPEAYSLIHPDEPENDEKLQFARQSLTNFFKHLHILLPIIEKAERMTKALATDLGRHPPRGAPEDEGRNWMFTRLMWLWRDVLDEKPSIHMRKTRDRVELDEPEPQGCMAFIVATLTHVEPIEPRQYAALERQLQTLRRKIPAESLLKDRSRAN